MPAKTPTSPTPDQRAPRPGSVRAFVGAPTSVDETTRSFDIVITTETPVRTWVPNPKIVNPETEDCSYIEVDEVLLAAGVDLSRAPRMPFIDCHDTWTSIDKILGKIDGIRVEGQSVVGRATLTRKRADLLADIADGFYGNISAGFSYDIRTDAEFHEREGEVPLVIVKRWCLNEASAVPLGADPNAFIRSLHGSAAAQSIRKAEPINKQERSMDVEEIVAAAEAAIAAAEDAIVAAEEAASGEGVADIAERVKALRGKRASDEDTAAAEEEKTDGERAEGDEPTDDEKREVEAVRSIAKSYGLTKLVDDLSGLRAKPAQIRAAVREAVMKRGLASTPETPAAVQPAKRSPTPSEQLPSARSIYANLNGRKA